MEKTKDRWELVLSHSAAKIFKAASADMRRRFEKCFDALEDNPLDNVSIKQLTGQLKGRYRYRVGDWRVIYGVDAATRTVAVITILPRGEAYK